MDLLFSNVYFLLAFLCGCTELKQSISVHSESVVTTSMYHLENVTSYVCGIENIRGVSSRLTWEMVFNSSFRPLFTDSDTIQTDEVKVQLCFRSVDPSVLMLSYFPSCLCCEIFLLM